MEPSQNEHGNLQIGQNSKPPANEVSQGKTGIHGTSYHLRVALVIMLRAIDLRRKGKLFDFKFTMEDPNAGKFDDVVFRYSLSSTPEEFDCVYIQAKHMQVKKTSITKDALLTKWNTKAQFSIPKYFTSYLHGYDPSLKGSHTYILCTNQSFDKKLLNNNNFVPREPDADNILSFCKVIEATCYRFNSQTEIESLKDELRMASLEKLGCMIADYVHKKKQMPSNIYMFKINVNLIAKCVEIHDSGTLQFNEEFRAADESTLVGRLGSGFVQEYIKLTRKNEVNWENVRIKVDPSFSESILDIDKNSLYGETQYYEMVDVIIQQFFDKFMFVSGSMSETEMLKKINDLMPPWMSNRESTYNSLLRLLLDSMNKSTHIKWQDLKQHFVETNTNEIFTMVRSSTNEYLDAMHVRYSDINVEPNRLKNALYDFINNTPRYDVYPYRHTTNMQVNCLIVAQTLALRHYRCLFVDVTSSKFKDKMFDVIDKLMEFFAAVDLSSEYIVTILGQQESAMLGAIRHCTESYKTKIIIVEAATADDLSKGRLFVSDLTEEARKQLFEQHDHFNLFGTTTALDALVRDNDSLSLLFDVLDKSGKIEMAENVNVKNFEKIASWYIPRSCAPYSEDKQKFEPHLVEQEITAVMLQSIIAQKQQASRFPAAFNNVNNGKIHIFLDEAGYGKSTYFTWLASAISKDNASLYVIRMNALEHSPDFSDLQHLNPESLDDTQIIRIFYCLWHMTLIVPNINIRSTKQLVNERKKAKDLAEHLSVSNNSIQIDDGLMKETQLSVDLLLQLRFFVSKLNGQQSVCLLDGVDEIAPHYKDFVMAYFARLATLHGIRNLYLSTRPYNFTDEFKYTFSGCKMWRIVPFSQTDRVLFFINYLEREMEEYKISNEDLQLKILKSMYTFTNNSIPDMKIIPLYLDMAANIFLSKVKTRQSVRGQAVSTELFEETKFDQLQIISYFIDEKLRIRNNEKAGDIDFASKTPVQIESHVKANNDLKSGHALLAMLVIFNKRVNDILFTDDERKQAVGFMREVVVGNEKTGIIREIRDDVPQFSHRIFAEYFSAYWIYSNKHRMRSESFFRSWEYWGVEEYRTRDFLNHLILRDCARERNDIHMAIINQSEQQLRELLSNDSSVALLKDAVGRLPLHLAVIYPSITIQKLLIEKTPRQSINTKDDLLGWTALDYAFAMRCSTAVNALLTAEADVNRDALLKQILSNKLNHILIIAHEIDVLLKFRHDHFHTIIKQVLLDLVENLLNEKRLKTLVNHRELEYLTVLEYCSKYNMIGLFEQLLSQIRKQRMISTQEINQVFKIASENKAHDIVVHLTEQIYTLLPELESIPGHIAAVRDSIHENYSYLFPHIFNALCLRINTHMVDDTGIVVDDYTPGDDSIPPLDKKHYPKTCCVQSSTNVGMPLPEYDEKDILNEGHVIEALLATAVHEGNLPMVKYIVQKTNMAISNRTIVMVMRLLPKKDDICHEKSMDAFSYLLERTTDRDSTDDQGRNLLHMTAQNGCFFMLRCLIANGFDAATANISNGWNVFHYIAFNQDEDRTDKILEFLLIKGYMHWFDDLDRMVDSESNLLKACTNQNTQSKEKLNKKQYALLALYVIFSKEDLAKLLSDPEQQEAMQCLREAGQSNAKTSIIQQVRDGIPKFAQVIFAEYYAACWIFDNQQRMRSESFFRSWTFWTGYSGSSKQYRTRDFLNRLITKDSERCDLHLAVINQSAQQVRALLSKHPSVVFEKDAVGRLPLHLAVTYSSEEIVHMLTEKMSRQAVNTKDKFFQWTALDYAFASRYEDTVQHLLTVGAVVDEDNLLQQILSNNLRSLITGAHYYADFLNSHDHSRAIANRLLVRSVEYLLYEKQFDVFSRHTELESLTVLEYCSKYNMIGIFKHLVSQLSIRERISTELSSQLFQIASENNAHDIKTYFVDENNSLLPQMKSVAELISAVKSCINRNKISSFKSLFHALCLRINTHIVADTDIVVDDYAPGDDSIPPLDKKHYPKICCVQSSTNVGMPLPEYDEKDILNEGHVIEALLATAVHEGNLPMVKYIVQKTNMAISNRTIVMVMRLLPKKDDICHEKSMDAFSYLLERTTDRDSTDDQGRNLLHMTAQNGCFFMLRCLIANGFDAATANISNGWNVFHYIAFNQDEDRTDKILEFLLIKGYMHWFDDLDRMVDSDSNLLEACTNQNTQSKEKLNKQQYALLALYVIFSKEDLAELLFDPEQQEAMQCLRKAGQSNAKASIIQQVRDGIPKFAQVIFAEYYAACWIFDNQQRMRSESFFRSWTFWTGYSGSSKQYRTRDFLNRLITKDSERCDLHLAVINQSAQQVRALLSKDPSVVFEKDAVGRLPLHLAVTYSSGEIVNMLTEKMSRQAVNTKDKFFQWTALDYAFANLYEDTVQHLLTVGAVVDEDNLLQQILSNNIFSLIWGAHLYADFLNSHDHSRAIANRLLVRSVEYLLYEKQFDVFSRHTELESLTVLEYCSKYNMIGIFKHLVSQLSIRERISTELSSQLFQIASENNAHDIKTYFVDENNSLLPQMKSVAELISAVKSCINRNQISSFKGLFHALCLRINTNIVDDTDIVVDDYAPGDDSIPPLDKKHYPKTCCVQSSTNVGMPLPEYDEKDILNEGHVIEALLATAVHEGNLPMVKYIVQKTNMAISNRTIVMVMRLLPKKDDICHEKSMDAFSYLLERTTDRDSTDDQGRNLLHMTAQNGCFFMLRCLIVKGFDPATANISNGWNVFHYIAFNQDEDRTDKILEFLLIKGYMHWFDDLDRMVDSDSNLLEACTNQNTQSKEKLNKQQYALLALYVIFSKEDLAELLFDPEQQEAMQCLREAGQSNAKTSIIQQVRDGIPKFAQVIFAEYYAACWIFDNQQRMRSESFFRSWTFWTGYSGSSKQYRTRDFLNRLITKDSERCDLHLAVINQSAQQVRALLSKDPSVVFEKDAVGRLPLHLAVTYLSGEIVNMLTEKMSRQAVNTKDKFFQWTALDYAFASRYEDTVQHLLTVGAVVDEDNLLQQILSNNLRSLITGAHYYADFLNSHGHSRAIANRLHVRSVEYLLYEKQFDVFSRHTELESLTVLEYCSKYNMIGIFKHLVSQLSIRERISTELSSQLFQIASENNAHDIKTYFVDENNSLLPQMKSVAELISAVKSCINRNQISSFKGLFHALCLRINTNIVDDTDIVVDDYAPGDDSIPPLDKKHYPKTCCVQSSTNVGMPLPEYDEKDILNEGHVIEALLATAVHEGNLPMVKYIVQKTNMAISNRTIVMVMRLLPKKDDICHEKSMDAFSYLLERTTDRDSTDDQGRNLLHMTAQNGCFFMLRCLIANEFDAATANISNGWNVFHYVAFNQDEDRTDKILEFLLIKGYMHWFDDLDRMVDSDSNLLEACTNQNTQSKEKLNKQQYALLALYVIFSKEDLAKLLSDPEQQEAMQCLREAGQSNAKASIIQQVRDGIPKFAQVIFAEYYAACWIFDNQQRMRSESFFRSWTFWTGYSGSSKQYRTRDFLNRLITKDSERCDLHLAVINQSAEQVRALLSKHPSVVFEKDAVGRLPLHLAVTYLSGEIVNMLTEKMSRQAVNTKDKFFQWTALDYAFANRYEDTVQHLLTVGAVVDEDNLLQQILSNNLRSLITSAHYYADFLNSHGHSRAIANRLHVRSVEYLLYEKQFDVFSRHTELESLTVLEYCSKYNMIGIFKHLVSQLSIRERISTELSSQLFQIASENNAHDIKTYFVDENNSLLPQMKSVAELISAVKSCINRNQISSFKGLFHALCLRINTNIVDDTDIVVDDYAPGDDSIPPLDKKHYPKTCCVQSSTNVGMPLPEYDEKDILNEGHVIEALLATAVHEGNLQMGKYIVQKTNMAISNRTIVMVMRLLPKKDDVCHEKSMEAFSYLLERTTDRDSTDDQGRNLLHMTAQNGCFFMLRCLIVKGFDVTVVNQKNDDDVFHYVAFDQDEDRKQKKVELIVEKMRQLQRVTLVSSVNVG
ncbi:uncharacterized protein LOC128297647 [Anopheles moucheti]|uniref:uncharacterized protein LOC128297647 n=1 Tax=Anopheles moucheti TaxID=186751 RepID=UPI0022F141A4|nr:uncharacterized protein LOC128297647 [Anopheles moucheti]